MVSTTWRRRRVHIFAQKVPRYSEALEESEAKPLAVPDSSAFSGLE